MIYQKGEQSTEIRENMRGGDGAVALTALVSALPDKMRLFSEIRLEPGCSIGYHTHEKETELFYFASGSGVVSDDGREVRVSPGDAMSTASGHGHSVKNDGGEPLVILAAIILD